MAKLMGKFTFKSDLSEIHLFDDFTYRYEPNYTEKGCENSFFKIEGNLVFFRHESYAEWTEMLHDDTEFIKNAIRITNEYLLETILLSDTDQD